MYTTYFGYVRNLDLKKYMPIGIAGKSIDGWNFKEYKKLAPTYELFQKYTKGEYGPAEYTQYYNDKILGNLNIEQVKNDIYKLAEGKIPVLICYETPRNFCHRQLVSKWFNDNNIFCEEL